MNTSLKTSSRIGIWLFIVALLAGGRCWVCATELGTTAPSLSITSMAVQGHNLVLTALVPPGLQSVTLETRSALDAPWDDLAQTNAPAGGGEETFVFPQPLDSARFFRLRANPIASAPVSAPQLISTELEYVATVSLGENLLNSNAVFHYKGQVDGSDKILITHEGALWTHVSWSYPPNPVSVNGTSWNPKEKNYLSTAGPVKFLPDSFSLSSVNLEVSKGRDIVALERTNGGLMVYLDDTPVGPGDYDFTITFHPVASEPAISRAGAVARLKVKAWESGSDSIKFTRDEAVLEHKFWKLPSNLSVNGVPWDPRQTTVLKNEGATRFLPDGIDFSTARIISRSGRDLATAWGEKDALWVRFADNPNGSDSYEIDIAFGPEQSQP